MFLAIIRHELKLSLAQGSGALNIFAFFIMAVTLFVFGIGPSDELMRTVAPSIVWVCALLTAMLSLPQIFARDYDDGTLEQLCMQGHNIEKVAFAKIVAHWLLTGIPLIFITPLLGYMLQMTTPAVLYLVISLVVGSPILSLIGAMGAGLTLGTRRAAALLGVLVLPLYIPVLIFGISGAGAYEENTFSAFLPLLGLLLLMLPLCIVASSFTLHMAVEEG